MSDLFNRVNALSPRQRSMLEHRLSVACDGEIPQESQIVSVARDEVLPLSFAQQRLWFLHQLDSSNPFYNTYVAVRLTGQLNVAAFEQTIGEVIKRHEVLRTIFASRDGQPVQRILSPVPFASSVINLTKLTKGQREAEAQRIAVKEMLLPFDLTRYPLIRTRLFQLKEKEYILLFVMHHIISDSWSTQVLIQETTALYEAFNQRKPSPLSDLPVQYADFAHWQRQRLQGDILRKQLSYWKEQLRGSPSVLELPTDRPRPLIKTSFAAAESIQLSKELSADLKELSQREGVTLFMTLLAAFQTLLHRYAGQDDILVGTPISGRTNIELEGLIGFFVNTLVLRTNFAGNPSFREILQRTRKVCLEAFDHQELPFEKLIQEMQPERNLNRQTLFQNWFQLDDNPIENLEISGMKLSPFEVDTIATDFDLYLSLSEAMTGLKGVMRYSTDLYNADTIIRMLRHFQMLLEDIIADPDQSISALSITTAAENLHLFSSFNAELEVY